MRAEASTPVVGQGEIPAPRRREHALGDRQLALVIGGVLFVLVGWPLFFLRIPPYQDLPGHLAAVTILANPEKYPEFIPTGFLKPNSLFFLWTLLVGRSIGFVAAAKVFTLFTL